MTAYKDCSGNTKELDEFHYHVLVDRIHCIQEMWHLLVVDHPACEEALGSNWDEVGDALGRAYQAAGNANFDRKQK